MVADERLTEFTVRAHDAAVEQRRGYHPQFLAAEAAMYGRPGHDEVHVARATGWCSVVPTQMPARGNTMTWAANTACLGRAGSKAAAGAPGCRAGGRRRGR
jgi:hypothetical protein